MENKENQPEEQKNSNVQKNDKYSKIYIALFVVLAGSLSAIAGNFVADCCGCCTCIKNEYAEIILLVINLVAIFMSFVVDILGICYGVFDKKTNKKINAKSKAKAATVNSDNNISTTNCNNDEILPDIEETYYIDDDDDNAKQKVDINTQEVMPKNKKKDIEKLKCIYAIACTATTFLFSIVTILISLFI